MGKLWTSSHVGNDYLFIQNKLELTFWGQNYEAQQVLHEQSL